MKVKPGIIRNVSNLARFNMSIIFGGKFIYFILAAFIFFLVFGTIIALNENEITEASVYGLLSFPAVLLVFYPSAFGIQNDADQRTLEIIFGIPNYRYKVWMVRLIMVLVLVSLLLVPFSGLARWALTDFPVFKMISQLMVLVIFSSTLGFSISTIVKNGNATAVIMVIIGLVFLIMSEPLSGSKWNILLNPFRNPDNINEIVWRETIHYNRIFMLTTGLVLFLLGLLNLQNREKFLR